MTHYLTPITQALLAQRDTWRVPDGWRLVRELGPWDRGAGDPPGGVILCEIEDDNADPDLEGKIVTPTFSIVGDHVEITSRTIETDTPPPAAPGGGRRPQPTGT